MAIKKKTVKAKKKIVIKKPKLINRKLKNYILKTPVDVYLEGGYVKQEIIDSHDWSDNNSEHSYCRRCTHWRHAKDLPMCQISA